MKLEEILDGILFCEDHDELTQMGYALADTWARVHPGWEMTLVSLPKKDSKEKRRLLEGMMTILQNAENALKIL